ncbi:lysozyme inhibitor LprI family protein [Zooshikella ganghwensis]|uniref:lysozyme inhibitor LprI family protein n=1 Tax=Zooshikella ganghwensis TaxID=202772 RepID=UPI0013FDF774|nr:lysozyme inhibitor LprI family protein [Zooshikella ganghwensis]
MQCNLTGSYDQMAACFVEERKQLLPVVKEIETKIEKKLPLNLRKDFIESQASWYKLAESDCKIIEHQFGRNSRASSLVVNECHVNRLKQRVKQLLDFLCDPNLECMEWESYKAFYK